VIAEAYEIAVRCLLVIICFIASPLLGAEADTPPPSVATASYDFVKSIRLYTYVLKQEVGWQSAGDKLDFTSEITWEFTLETVSVAADHAILKITITHVLARQSGPGSDHHVDSRIEADKGDPLLGGLLAHDGVMLTLTIDPANGVVSHVTGGEQIVARLNQLYKSPDPPAVPPPFDEKARELYSPEKLARWWTAIFALPSERTSTLPLNPPLSGELARHWTGTTYTVSLPDGVTKLSATLLSDPTPLAVTLSNLTGKGDIRLAKGYPAAINGELSFDLDAVALTQPVTQKQRITWSLVER
jgi:hypothetical protein